MKLICVLQLKEAQKTGLIGTIVWKKVCLSHQMKINDVLSFGSNLLSVKDLKNDYKLTFEDNNCMIMKNGDLKINAKFP